MNDFEVAARERKAHAIAHEVGQGWRLLDLWDRTERSAADLARAISDQATRDLIARAADQKTPSTTTWELVVAILDARVGAS